MAAPVVVGVDDVDQSPHALELAGREAELRGASLWIAHVFHRAPPDTAGVAGDGTVPEGAVPDTTTEPLAGALERVHTDHPYLQVRSYAMSGPPAVALAALAKEASLLVVGHRGRGGLAGMLIGSVALRTLAHARCPVAVARGARRAVNRVLVGVDVDDDAGSRAHLDFAFEEAALRGAELVVLHVWEDAGYFYPDPAGDYTRDHLATLDSDHRRRLETVLAPWRDAYPQVAVDILVEGGSTARRLVDASDHAGLLVIGRHVHHDDEGMRTGTLAYTLLRHARCPVVFVPER